jgi:hypothetical protein
VDKQFCKYQRSESENIFEFHPINYNWRLSEKSIPQFSRYEKSNVQQKTFMVSSWSCLLVSALGLKRPLFKK